MSTTDTERDERLRGIQERADAATPGPWYVWNDEDETWVGAPEWRHLAKVSAWEGPEPSARFIAAARADVPWLLVEVARLDAVVTEQAATIQRVEDLVAAGEEAFAKIGVPGAVDLPAVRRALDGGTCDHHRLATYEDPNHRAWVCQHCGDEGTEDKT